MTWILYALLATGEAGPVPVDQATCQHLASSLAAGAHITVDRYDGTSATLAAAACLGPADADPCQVEAST